MSTNIYVGNLTFDTDSRRLEDLFSAHGSVTKAQVITDRETGRSRGFGFVEMDTAEAAEQAISALNGKDFGGRQLTVNLAQERSR
jgi:RNA recognition motif-containing protein